MGSYPSATGIGDFAAFDAVFPCGVVISSHKVVANFNNLFTRSKLRATIWIVNLR